jgi:hypothetical protein
MAARRALGARPGPRWYLVAIVVTLVLSDWAQYIWQYAWPQMPLIKDQPPGVWLTFVGLLAALVLWAVTDGRRMRSTAGTVFLGGLLATWLVVLLVSKVHDDPFTYAVWAAPVILLMIYAKEPQRADLRAALVLLAWLLAGVLVATRVLEMVGMFPVPMPADYVQRFEEGRYWLPLDGIIGPDVRWTGPMRHNAMTGSIGAYLVVLGVALRTRSAYVLSVVGVLTLLLTSSRVSMIAAVFGVGVALLFGPYRWSRRIRPWWAVTALAGLLVAAAAYVAVRPATLTGRPAIWETFYGFWQSSPWIGVGNGYVQLLGQAPLPNWVQPSNAHNLVLQVISVYGLVTLVPVLAALAASVLVCVRAARERDSLPAAVVGTFLVIGLTAADKGWFEPSEPWLLLVLATLLALPAVRAASAVPVTASGREPADA